MLNSVDFDETLLHGMLSFLLFAGALHVNLNDLAQQRGVIAVLATADGVGRRALVNAAGLAANLEEPALAGRLVRRLVFQDPTDEIEKGQGMMTATEERNGKAMDIARAARGARLESAAEILRR